MINKLF